ncbi:MAG: hypothetical protein CMM52_06225 [Rhodospirillaceae bacterium]|nr:hypothetical protein [Rhodospirillaceae bacterium]
MAFGTIGKRAEPDSVLVVFTILATGFFTSDDEPNIQVHVRDKNTLNTGVYRIFLINYSNKKGTVTAPFFCCINTFLKSIRPLPV